MGTGGRFTQRVSPILGVPRNVSELTTPCAGLLPKSSGVNPNPFRKVFFCAVCIFLNWGFSSLRLSLSGEGDPYIDTTEVVTYKIHKSCRVDSISLLTLKLIWLGISGSRTRDYTVASLASKKK